MGLKIMNRVLLYYGISYLYNFYILTSEVVYIDFEVSLLKYLLTLPSGDLTRTTILYELNILLHTSPCKWFCK